MLYQNQLLRLNGGTGVTALCEADPHRKVLGLCLGMPGARMVDHSMGALVGGPAFLPFLLEKRYT